MASLYQEVLDQTVSAIESLALEDADSETIDVFRAKRFVLLENEGSQIHVISMTEEELPDSEAEGFENVVFIRYPVFIGIVLPNSGNLLDGASENLMLTIRQAIRRKLHSVSVLVPTEPIVGVDIDLQPAFDRAAFGDNINVSAMIIMYDICEPRFE